MKNFNNVTEQQRQDIEKYTAKLKTCTCGSNDLSISINDRGRTPLFMVRCNDCSMHSNYEKSPYSAHNNWNFLIRRYTEINDPTVCVHCSKTFTDETLVDGFCESCTSYFDTYHLNKMKGYDSSNLICRSCGWSGDSADACGYDEAYCPECDSSLDVACECVNPHCGMLYDCEEYVDGFCPDCEGSVACDHCKMFFDPSDLENGLCEGCIELGVGK